MKRIWEALRWFLHKNSESALDAWAGQAAFFIVISVFPAMLLVFSLSRAMHIADSGFLQELVRLLPAAAADLIFSVMQEATARAEAAFVSFSALAALWAVSRSMYAVIRGFNAVYGVEETRHFLVLRLMAFVYTVVFFLLIAATLVLLVFWQAIVTWLVPLVPGFRATAVFVLSFRSLAAVVVFTLFFLCMFKFLPNRSLPFGQLLPGAVFSALGWLVFSRAYSFYIDRFSNYTTLYGSLTAVVLCMLWLYFCMYILFLGGVVNLWLQDRK